MRYTVEQRSWLLKEYVKTNNAEAVRRNWTAKYGTPPPFRKSIYRIRDKFNATGSILNAKIPGQPKSVNTEQNQELNQSINLLFSLTHSL